MEKLVRVAFSQMIPRSLDTIDWEEECILLDKQGNYAHVMNKKGEEFEVSLDRIYEKD